MRDSRKPQPAQEPLIESFHARRQYLMLFMMSGAKVCGYLEGFDEHTMLLDGGRLVYKTSISNVVPVAAPAMGTRRRNRPRHSQEATLSQ